MLSKYYWRTLKLNLKWVKFWSRTPGLRVHICKNLSTGNCPCFVSQGEPQLKRLFQFRFQNESNFDIFADSLGLQQLGTLCCKGRFNLLQFYDLSSPVPLLFGARTLIQFLQFVIVALQLRKFICCNFTSSFSALVCICCSRMTCKSGQSQDECNKFKKSHSEPTADSMKATKHTENIAT